MTLGEKIAELRKEKKWTQDEFADKVGVHGRHVSRWERNINHPPPKTLSKIAEVFKINPDELKKANGATPEALMNDPDLLAQFEAVAQLDEKEKEAVKLLLQAVITKHQVKNLVGR